jgi:hypothetical protein
MEVPRHQILFAAVLVVVLVGLVASIVFFAIPPGGPPTLR